MGQVGVVGYEPFYVWVVVELRRSIPKGTVSLNLRSQTRPFLDLASQLTSKAYEQVSSKYEYLAETVVRNWWL